MSNITIPSDPDRVNFMSCYSYCTADLTKRAVSIGTMADDVDRPSGLKVFQLSQLFSF